MELYQSNHGTAGNREAGGFVNSAVSYKTFPKKPLEGIVPIDGFSDGTMERWNSTSQIMERPGTVRPTAL